MKALNRMEEFNAGSVSAATGVATINSLRRYS